MTNIEKFFAFLNASDAVTVDGGALLDDWETEKVANIEENEVARFSWTDGECEYSTFLTEVGISNGVFNSDGKFVCEDSEGQKTVFRFFKVQPIVSV